LEVLINNMHPEEHFQNFLTQEQLADQKLLLMISGGVDSCVLLEVASKVLPVEKITVLHINHKTRADCDKDETLVQNICSTKNITCVVKKLSTPNSAKNKEASWRQQRQKLSAQVAKEVGATRILTAHHATDLVETMIFRLTKGCGVKGLSPFDTSTKPFWKIPKTDLIAYAQEKNLKWHEDESNDDPTYQRNLIRHEVLPALRRITPNLEKVFVRESLNFAEIQEYIDLQTQTSTPLELTKFVTWPIILQKNFLRQVAKTTVSSNDIDDCLKWLKNNPSGNSQKSLGKTSLKILSGKIVF